MNKRDIEMIELLLNNGPTHDAIERVSDYMRGKTIDELTFRVILAKIEAFLCREIIKSKPRERMGNVSLVLAAASFAISILTFILKICL